MAINCFFSLLRKSNMVYESYFEDLIRRNGLNATAFQVLMFFADHPEENTARDLCRLRSMKTGIVSVAIDQLNNAGLLERKTDGGDRRLQRLYLTEKARPLVEEGMAIRMSFFTRIKKDLTEEEFRIFYNLTRKLRSTIEEMEQEMK